MESLTDAIEAAIGSMLSGRIVDTPGVLSALRRQTLASVNGYDYLGFVDIVDNKPTTAKKLAEELAQIQTYDPTTVLLIPFVGSDNSGRLCLLADRFAVYAKPETLLDGDSKDLATRLLHVLAARPQKIS